MYIRLEFNAEFVFLWQCMFVNDKCSSNASNTHNLTRKESWITNKETKQQQYNLYLWLLKYLISSLLFLFYIFIFLEFNYDFSKIFHNVCVVITIMMIFSFHRINKSVIFLLQLPFLHYNYCWDGWNTHEKCKFTIKWDIHVFRLWK